MGPYNPMMPFPQYPYQQQAYQPMPQTVMPNQSRTISPIAGRVVNSLGEITVQEVPTDGTVAWFPFADGSCVYGKQWTPDGNITTMRFVPEAADATPSQPDPFQLINARIDELVDLVEDISDNMPRPAETKHARQTAKRRVVKTDAE